MIPCSGSEIHRWNALDDLDDDISDRVNDDLIPFDDDEYEYEHEHEHEYDDPDLVVMDSFSSSDSTVEDSEQYKNSSNEYSQVDEDGLILALDDSTNRQSRNRDDRVAKTRSSNSDIVNVRVKKSVKYGNKENTAKRTLGMTEVDKKSILRPIPSDSRQIIRPEINTIYSDGTMNSLSPTEENQALTATSNSNIITVRVKKSVKYGSRENAVSSKNDIARHVPSNSREILRPKINTVHSDGTISSLSPTGDENFGAIVPHDNTQPRIATIYSDGSIGYKDENNIANAIVEKPVQKIATINSDGTITYRLGSQIGDNETGVIVTKPASTVATIHGDGFITYNSTATSTEIDAKSSPTLRKVSFDNVVTDSEHNGGDDDDMDDDICDNVDDSRYTRSLHSMPVLEEVTEEESPLHSDNAVRVKTSSSSPKEVNTSPTWLELQKSPSATTTMTPRRTNDEENGEEFGTSADLAAGWLGLKGFGSHKKNNIGSKYQSIDGSKIRSNPYSSGSKKSPRDTRSPRNNIILQVETCSTGSHAENDDFSNDVETGGNNGIGKGLCCRKSKSSEGYLNFTPSNGNRSPKKNKKSCCFRRRDWIAALLIVLIGITVGVVTYFVMDKILVEGDEDRQKGRTEELTMTEGTPMIITINEDGENSTSIFPISPVTESENFNSPEISMVPSDAPIDVDAFKTESPTTSPTIVEIIPINGGMVKVVQDTIAITEVIRKARRQIELLIFDDSDLIGKVSWYSV